MSYPTSENVNSLVDAITKQTNDPDVLNETLRLVSQLYGFLYNKQGFHLDSWYERLKGIAERIGCDIKTLVK